MSFLLFIIWAYMALLVFSFLFYKLDLSRVNLIRLLQLKVNHLDKNKRDKLNIVITMVTFVIIFLLPTINGSDRVAGILIGLLYAVKDVCFSKNLIGDTLKNASEGD